MEWVYDRFEGARITDKLSWYGVNIVVMENDIVRVVVLPSRGGDIVSFYYKPALCECMMKPKVKVPVFDFNPLKPKEFSAGVCSWVFMFPVASEWGDYFGVDQPFHGEAHLLPWDYSILKDTEEEVVVELRCRMQLSPFEVVRKISLRADEPEVRFEEQVKNLSEVSLPIMWGHHPTFGKPFLSDKCRIYLPEGKFYRGDESMLRIRKEGVGVGNMFYLVDFDDGWYGIYNEEKEFGFGMRWDCDLFRVVWIWQEYGSDDKGPYFGQRYAVAVEPVSSLPQIESIDEDMRDKYGPIEIKPKGEMSAELSAFIFTEPSQIGSDSEWVL